jgi:hypothetical protein
MTKVKVYLSVLFLVLFFISSFASSGLIRAVELEWKVAVGDSITLELTQFYDNSDSDGDGNINTHRFTITDENDHSVNITWTAGSKIKNTISQLNDSGAYIKRTYDGKVTGKETRTTLIVQKTVDNVTYWEEYAQLITTSTRNASVDGSLFIVEEKYIIPPVNDTLLEMLKYDLKSGWLVYQYQKLFNSTTVIGESTFTKTTGGLASLEIPIIFSGAVIVVLFRRRSYQKGS